MSAPKSRRPRRSPRRKAGRTDAPEAKRKIAFRLSVEGQEMLVSYEPYWSDGEFAVGHFEFRSPHNPPRRIIVSETGYRSHFAAMAEIEAMENPEAFARQYVLAVLKAGSKTANSAREGDQLSLF